jgi:hypothetical protein
MKSEGIALPEQGYDRDWARSIGSGRSDEYSEWKTRDEGRKPYWLLGVEMEDAEAPLVVTIRSSSQAELEYARSVLNNRFDLGPVIAERASNRLNFDPALGDAGFKVLVAIGPVVATKLIDWAIEAAKQRGKRARGGEKIPALLIEVNGRSVSVKGTAKPAVLRAALESALTAREA